MASTISLEYALKAIGTETMTGNYVQGSNNSVTYGLTDETAGTPLTASTAVPITKRATGQLTMSGGAGTINLAALPGETDGETIDLTGLKVQLIIFRSLSSNANLITATKGASNGYGLGASGASWTLPLSPAQLGMLLGKDLNPDVASGARTIDVAGTGSQVLEYVIFAG